MTKFDIWAAQKGKLAWGWSEWRQKPSLLSEKNSFLHSIKSDTFWLFVGFAWICKL